VESKENTIRLLTKMYADCFKFWLHEGKSVAEALQKALSEVSEMTHNPFEPCGDLLNEEGKQEFVERIKRDLRDMSIRANC
jgi:hypothetical protein